MAVDTLRIIKSLYSIRSKSEPSIQGHIWGNKNRTDAFKKNEPKYFYNKFQYYDIPDAYSPAIVRSLQGIPISQLQPGRYSVHGVNPQVNPGPLDRYKQSIQEIVSNLEPSS